MICRNIDWISDWISASVFSAGGADAVVDVEEGAAFSLSVGLDEDEEEDEEEDLEDFLEGRENI